jgi:hypothetical protein
MQVSLLYIILFAAVLTGWTAIGWYSYQAKRRRDRWEGEFERMTTGLPGLDAELGRLWGVERARRAR